jgi:hypothetical protein
MYSNDTKQLLNKLTKQLKSNKNLREIFKSIQVYLNSNKIKSSLDIIYQLIMDNYCDISQKIQLDIQTNVSSNNLNAKFENIIFLSKEDRTHIQNTLPLISLITASHKSNTIQLYVVSGEDDELKSDILQRILSKLFLLIDLFTEKKNTTYHLYIWLSDLKKHKPTENSHVHNRQVSKKTFRSQHINSGATVHNLLDKSVELFIWRKEEIEKVLLHEMIHTLKLDFMGYPEELKRDIIDKFNIPSAIELRLGEAYVETWAVILNTIFVSFTKNRKLSIKTQCDISSKKFFKLFAMEIYFTLFQSSKILRHFGYECVEGCEVPFIKSNQVGETGEKLFKQDTYVFSYYLIKAGVLMNLGEFFNYCCKNNKQLLQFVESPVNFKELHRIFIESAKQNKLLNDMVGLNLDYKADGNELLDNTMRMTLYELKL